MSYRIIGCDPGQANYGYTRLIAKFKTKLTTQIDEIGMFNHTINNLTNKPAKPPKSRRKKEGMWPPLQEKLPEFEEFWNNELDEFKPQAFFVERFQNRGIRGRSAETISIMNGLLASLCIRRGIEFQMITAATWKNRVNKYLDLKTFYPTVKLKDHSVDSSFIAVYGAVQHFKIDWTEVSFNAHVKELRAFDY